MQNNLEIAIIQADLIWENPIENRLKFDQFFSKINNVDLLVLPEMFTTGFSMTPTPFAETMNGETVKWMQQNASKLNAAIVGSIIIKEENQFYNRMLFVHPNGHIEHYDKRHAFTLAGEHKEYTIVKKSLSFRKGNLDLVCIN